MDDLVKALRSGEQADMHGTFVKVSRQACEEAADAIEALQAQLAEARDKALEDAAKMVDCGCECREAVLSATTKTERWRACGRDPCGALDAAAIRAMKGERG